MLKPMFGRQPRPRKFDLPLRYYDPTEDDRRKRRIKIETHHRRRPNQGLRVLSMAILLVLILWMIS